MHRCAIISKCKRMSIYEKRHITTSIENMKSILTIDDIPHQKYLPIIGTRLDFFIAGGSTRLHEYIDFRHKQLGSIFREKLASSSDLVFISDSELMKSLFIQLEGKYPAHILPEAWVLYEKLYGSKRGLFFMDGEEWLHNRRITNKHLLREESEKWLQKPIEETIQRFIQNWKIKAKQNPFVPDLESEFYKLSTDVIIAILLGNNSSIKPDKYYEQLLNVFSESVKKIFQTTTRLYALPINICQKFNFKVWRDFKESVDVSLSLAQKIASEILSKAHESDGLIKRLCTENMPDKDITKIVADFVIAAGDTTAYTSLWILYLLSKHAEIVNEIRSKDSTYIKYVVKESMRLYPVAPFLTRIIPKESILGPYKLHAGTPVIASIYTSGRDDNNFSRPHDFLPYRWDRSDPRKKELINHIPSASLPFALGSRSCIGKKIAMLQISELIKQITDNFDLEFIGENEVKTVTSQILVPNKKVEIKLIPQK
uniref:Cholesterol side-chain cleavage enzyme, mitochondrial n=1 Tax=Antheraea pernyi TaxID=7119 RepID=A0A975YZM9_ANTPE|nr:cytochrome P450 315a1 [Antheraea pernyi]